MSQCQENAWAQYYILSISFNYLTLIRFNVSIKIENLILKVYYFIYLSTYFCYSNKINHIGR